MQSLPNRIGKYELISRLGRGGMGEVYKAFHPQLQRYVAIKVLLSTSETDPEFIARFQNEAMAVARLRHPHIVQVFDFDIEGDTPYMVMEFVEGETLAQRIADFQRAEQLMPTAEVARLFQQLCAAIDYAHQQGMLHRDIKPANVIINRHNDAILTDFGLAKIQGVSKLTASGIVMGTPHYMSPEQAQGQPMDGRGDIYSLSIMLYELLAGKVPFNADTPVAIIMQHITQPPPPIEIANPAAPEALAQVALVGMSKRPDERFRTAGAMGNAIRVAMSHLSENVNAAAPAHLPLTPPDSYATRSVEQRAVRADQREPANVLDNATTMLSELPNASTQRAPDAAKQGIPAALQAGAPPQKPPPAAPPGATPGISPPKRPPISKLGRLALISIIIMLLALSGGILVIVLGGKGTSQQTSATGPTIVGTVTFSDSDPNEFSHPANQLTGDLSKLARPANGATYFAWLCDSGTTTTCTLLGPVLLDASGNAKLNIPGASNFLSVQNLNNLHSTLTFEITQEQTEASAPPQSPSNTVAYSGRIQANVLLHIRHQIAAFPKQNLFAGNTTALDTGLGLDATLLQQLSHQIQQDQARNNLSHMKLTAEYILNLIAGKEGARDWDQDGHTDVAQGDDGFGIGTDATVNPSDCTGPKSTYLALTMQHACLAAKASGSSGLQHLFSAIQRAGSDIATALATIQRIAQQIVAAQAASAISQGDVNTLAAQADAVLQGVPGETQTQDGARQILSYSEQMATITIRSL